MNALIKEIHDQVWSAERRLQSSVLDIEESKIKKAADDIAHVKIMGFKNIKNTNPHQEYKMNEELFNQMNELKEKYPLYKFITEDQLQVICKKYNLVIGWPEIFTAEIPQKNIKEMSNFKMDKDDLHSPELKWELTSEYSYEYSAHVMESLYVNRLIVNNNVVSETVSIDGGYTPSDLSSVLRHMIDIEGPYGRSVHLQLSDYRLNMPDNPILEDILERSKSPVVATTEHFDMTEKAVGEDHYIIDKVDTKVILPKAMDPIVLKRTKYKNILAVVTAWGDEANDPALINEIYN